MRHFSTPVQLLFLYVVHLSYEGESIKLHSRLKTDKIPAFWEKDGKYVAQASLVTNVSIQTKTLKTLSQTDTMTFNNKSGQMEIRLCKLIGTYSI